MADIQTRHLFTLKNGRRTTHQIGQTPTGQRTALVNIEGSFEGERLRGSLLPGGTDWVTELSDGTRLLDCRLVLKTHDEQIIGMSYRGMRHGPAEATDRLSRGEAVDPALFYHRVAVFFETSAPDYLWLNRVVAIASGRRVPESAIYEVFEVL